MKIIRVIGENFPPEVDFHPDSALILPGRPFFVPDFGDEWKAKPYIAVKINRLGKNIGKRFVKRYYESLSIGIHLSCDLSSRFPGLFSGLDSSIAIGSWMAIDELRGSVKLFAKSGESIQACLEEGVEGLISHCERAICEISAYATLKMGDVIFIPFGTFPFIPLRKDRNLDFILNENLVYTLRIV